MRTTAARAIAALALFLTVAGCSGTPGASAGASEPAPSPTSNTLAADIDVGGGRTIHIVCVGPTDSGRPTIVFEAGLGGDFRTWGEPMGGLKATDRACSYDRAGNGMSPPVAAPRTTQDQVAELHTLLAAVDAPAPYVLIGYSIGGWNVSLYTATYPDEVAGVVLVDVRPPGMSAAILALLPPETAGEPDPIHQNRADVTVFEHDPSLNSENLDIAASAAQALAAPGFGDRPTAILWASDRAGLWEGLPADLAASLDAAYLDLRASVEGLASDAEVTLVDAPHEIPGEAPDAVLDAVRSVLGRLTG